MTLIVVLVMVAFGLLHLAVMAEERHLQEAARPRKR